MIMLSVCNSKARQEDDRIGTRWLEQPREWLWNTDRICNSLRETAALASMPTTLRGAKPGASPGTMIETGQHRASSVLGELTTARTAESVHLMTAH